MDNVLVNFQSGIDQLDQKTKEEFNDRLDEVPGIFGLMQPMQGAIEAIHELHKHFDVYILSTAPWLNASAWHDKVEWIKKYLPEIAYKRLILSHHKHLNKGHYLIDDRTANGAGDFEGEHIHFGQAGFKNWEDVSAYLLSKVKHEPETDVLEKTGDVVERARNYAIRCHTKTKHTYNGKPYEFHLEMVYNQALKYAHLVPIDKRNNFLAAAWVHDVIEDCRETYNDVAMATNGEVADLAYALTNEKGKNRIERANAKYFEGIRQVPNAVLLKVCDRLANLMYSIETSPSKTAMYISENESFVKHLNDGSCDSAFTDLMELCDGQTN
jgi:5'(3')-deoxyribonucleotidase